jgi:3'-phosphoadenosine 5'-phosphosulfate sulfotransferase (PAPS reductase)/FAD synthetase
MSNDFLLIDRIDKIKSINEKYDLENNAYISFSGGKDSTILHYLIDLALPNNKIPRVFINTGIEYSHIVKFIKQLAEKDERIVILNSGVNIKEMLETYGYPFKSKQHSHNLAIYQRNKHVRMSANFRQRYTNLVFR